MHSTVPVPALPAQDDIIETVLRFSRSCSKDEPRSRRRITYSGNTFHGVYENNDNMIEETITNHVVTGIRTNHLSRPDTMFSSKNILRYIGVSMLELCCPVSITWVFDFTSCLPNLKYIRFGGSFFHETTECYEPIVVKKIEDSPSVRTFILGFDKPSYDKLDKIEQEHIRDKIEVLLGMVAKHFTRLSEVNLTMPEGPAIDRFLAKVPQIKLNGLKQEHYRDKMVTFNTFQAESNKEQVSPTSNNKRPKEPEVTEMQIPIKKIKMEAEPAHLSIPIIEIE